MDPKTYIQSGAIEACISGNADKAALEELHRMAALYPEVKAAREILEFEWMQESRKSAGLQNIPAADGGFSSFDASAQQNPEKTETAGTAPAATAAIPQAPKSIQWLRGTLAACLMILMGSIALNFYFYSQSVQNLSQVTPLSARVDSFAVVASTLQTSMAILASPDVKRIPLKPVTADSTIEGINLYLSVKSGKIYFNADGLPAPAKGKEYQLWAIVNGAPEKAGLITQPANPGLQTMPMIGGASVYMLTLQPKGGSAAPTQNTIILKGEVTP